MHIKIQLEFPKLAKIRVTLTQVVPMNICSSVNSSLASSPSFSNRVFCYSMKDLMTLVSKSKPSPNQYKNNRSGGAGLLYLDHHHCNKDLNPVNNTIHPNTEALSNCHKKVFRYRLNILAF